MEIIWVLRKQCLEGTEGGKCVQVHVPGTHAHVHEDVLGGDVDVRQMYLSFP